MYIKHSYVDMDKSFKAEMWRTTYSINNNSNNIWCMIKKELHGHEFSIFTEYSVHAHTSLNNHDDWSVSWALGNVVGCNAINQLMGRNFNGLSWFFFYRFLFPHLAWRKVRRMTFSSWNLFMHIYTVFTVRHLIFILLFWLFLQKAFDEGWAKAFYGYFMK